MEERKTFTYDGMNSADFDLYIAGDSVYDAPTRDMDMITIPGRNGQLSIDQGRFENITVTYPCFIWADTQAEFRTKVRAIRNWLCAKTSYFKLSDEYNPESYRLGIYKSGLEVEPIFYNKAGRFELSFDCKPQRFLFAGEEVFTLGEWGETETYSGSIVSFDGTETTAIKSLKVNITPKQSGSGDPSPSNVRPISGWDSVDVHVSATTSGGSTITTNLPQTVYGGVLDVVSGKLKPWGIVDLGTLTWLKSGISNRFYSDSLEGIIKKAEVTPYAPSTVKANVASSNYKTVNGYDGYNGTINNAVSTCYFNDKTYVQINDQSKYDSMTANEFKTAMNGVQLVYELATPTEIQLTPTEVNTLLGSNNIWADAGTVEVEIGENPNILTNPTPFESCPIFEVEGSGTLTVNNSSMNIANNGMTVIDSEMMEAYEEENGAIISRNDMVSGEFPTLKEGNNNIGTVGLTSVKVKPKWWEV